MKDVLVSSVIKKVGTMPLPDAGYGLLGGRLGWSCHGRCSHCIRVVNVAVRTIVINVTIITATLLLLCIGVSDDAVAMAAPPSPDFQLPSSGAAATWNAGDSSSLPRSGSSGKCRVTACWDAYHAAVDASLLGLSAADMFYGDSDGDPTYDSHPSSPRFYDRLMMTTKYCSRRHGNPPMPIRQQKRRGKATAPRPRATEHRRPGGQQDDAVNSTIHWREKDNGNGAIRNVRDDHQQQPAPRRRPASSPAMADVGRRRLCVALRRLVECIERSGESCRGELSYHSSRRLAKSNLNLCNCTAEDLKEESNSNSSAKEDGGTGDFDQKNLEDLMLNDLSTVSRRLTEWDGEVGQLSDSCRYQSPARSVDARQRSSSTMKLDRSVCAAYGDPHFRTFDGLFQTCLVLGTWPLVDNEYLTVQTTNVRMGRNGGTATSKVSVLVKPYANCSAPPGRYLTYIAEDGRLPVDWDSDSPFVDTGLHYWDNGDGRRIDSGLLIDEIDPGEHVEIYLAYIDLTVSLKLVGRHYSVTISCPPETLESNRANLPTDAEPMSFGNSSSQDVNATAAETAIPEDSFQPAVDIQLCVRGCPRRESIDLASFFHRERQRDGSSSGTRVKYNSRRTVTSGSASSGKLPVFGVPSSATSSSSSSSSLPLMSFEAAYRSCSSDGHLVGYFLDSCVFDLLNTGDLPFSQTAARGAIFDLRRFIGSSSSSSSPVSLVGTSSITDRRKTIFDTFPVTSSGVVWLPSVRHAHHLLAVAYILSVIATFHVIGRSNFLTVAFAFADDFARKSNCNR